jgi:hypothetical protein
MKYVPLNWVYAFTPASRTIDFTTQPGFDYRNLFAIINLTQNKLMYAVGQAGLGASVDATKRILSLQFDTTLHSASDTLQFIVDEGNDNLADLIALATDNAVYDPDMAVINMNGPGLLVRSSSLESQLKAILLELRVLNFNFSQIGSVGGPAQDLDALRNELDDDITDV